MACPSCSAFFSLRNSWHNPFCVTFLKRRRLLLATTVVVLVASSILAQDASTGAVKGTVMDSTGGVIVDATVVLLNVATGFRYSIATDPQGRFAFQMLPPGEYVARATATAMSAQVTPRLQVAVGGLTEVQFKLRVAGAKEEVTVSGAPPTVDTNQPRFLRGLRHGQLTTCRLTGAALLT